MTCAHDRECLGRTGGRAPPVDGHCFPKFIVRNRDIAIPPFQKGSPATAKVKVSGFPPAGGLFYRFL